MNKNIIQFIVDENGQYINIPVGRVKAKSNLTTRIQLVTPITSSVAVNYLIYDSKNIEKKQYLIPTGDLGSAVVDPNSPNYQLVAGWKVYEADIYAPILSVISRFRTGRVGMSFEFVQQVPNALCTNFVDYFGFNKDLPETAEVGDYYICEDYNVWYDENLYNKGDILVWYGEKWNNGGILPKGLSETVDISVDPAISYPTEDVDETAFGNAIGEIAEDVAELDTRLNGVETDLNGKQDKVDALIETTDKTVVGAINELNSDVNTLDSQVNDLYATKQNKIDNDLDTTSKTVVGAINELNTHADIIDGKAEQALNKSIEANSKSDEAINTAGAAKDIAEGIDDKATSALNTSATALDTANEAHTIAIGASSAIALNDEAELLAYISDQTNKDKHNVGDAIYLKQTDVPDYWITEVLDIPNASGYYYEIEPLESKLPDITNMVTTDTSQSISGAKNFTGSLKMNGVDVAVVTDITKEKIGLGNVDNTSDQNKPISNATQQAIDELQNEVDTKQDELVSGVNIKTINNTNLLGSGDIEISLNGIDYLKDPAKSYLVIKTPADNDTFTLLTGTTGSPNYTIEWGDGTSEAVTTTDNPSHEYETAGMYLITISGSFTNGIEYGFNLNVNKNKIIEVYGGSNYRLSIASDSFNYCASLTTANIPNATSIGSSAFNSCSSLTTVNFPRATSIGSNAFEACSSLTTANFPNATSIGNYAFRICTSLKELTLGNVTTSSTGTRFQNVKLTNLTIAQDATDTDIERITTFFKANGGTFIGTETKHGLQVEKTPTTDLDVVRNIDLEDLEEEIDLKLDKLDEDKVDKEEGKGLSTNDYTDEEKQKLEDIDTTNYVDKLDIVNNLQSTEASKVLSAAQGKVLKDAIDAKELGRSFETIQAMVTALNSEPSDTMRVAFNLLVIALDVPDFWVTEVMPTSEPYTYSTDEALINAVKTAPLQIGYYKISLLETAKVDLGDYVQKTRTIAGLSLSQDITKSALQSALDFNTKVDKVEGKGLSTNDYTTLEKNKLAGIDEGAQVNAVTSVAGRTGDVTIAKTDVGLGNVDNTSDQNKPISNATQSALDTKQDELQIVSDEATAETQSLANPDNFYFYEEE